MAFWNTASVYTWLTDHVLELNRAIEPLQTGRLQADPPHERLPWQAETSEEQPYESLFREEILALAQRPQEFLVPASEVQAMDIQAAISGVAGAVLEVDAALRQLRFRLVPKHITEEQFWGRYFAAVSRIKKRIMATEMADDPDMVHVPMSPECSMRGDGEDDAASLQGRWLHRDAFAGRAASKHSEATDLVLSGHSAVTSGSFTSKRRKQPCERPGLDVQQAGSTTSTFDQAQMRLRIPGIATSQADSLTEGMLMSPTSEADTQCSRMHRDMATLPMGQAPADAQFVGDNAAATLSDIQQPLMRPAASANASMLVAADPADLDSSHTLPDAAASQQASAVATQPLSSSSEHSHLAVDGSLRLRRLADAMKAAQGVARLQDLQDQAKSTRQAAQRASTNAQLPERPGRLAHSRALLAAGNAVGTSIMRALSHSRERAREPGSPSCKRALWQSKAQRLRAEEALEAEDSSSEDDGADDSVAVAVWALFNPMADSPQAPPEGGKAGSTADLARAGPLLQRAAALTADMASVSDMAALWTEVMQELRWHWSSVRPLPGVQDDAVSAADALPLEKSFQALNRCLKSRRHQGHLRRQHPTPDSGLMGAVCLAEGMFLQATGEQMYTPALQDETFTSGNAQPGRPPSLQAACQRLASDMAAFKAANPGCELEDFTRWVIAYPVEAGTGARAALAAAPDQAVQAELWHKTEPLPACMQAPLDDPVKEGEAVVNAIASTPPGALFGQLFTITLGLCLEAASSTELAAGHPTLQAAVAEVRSFTESACQAPLELAQAERACQVFAHLEDMFRSAAAQAALQSDAAGHGSWSSPQAAHAAGHATASDNSRDDDLLDLDDWMML